MTRARAGIPRAADGSLPRWSCCAFGPTPPISAIALRRPTRAACACGSGCALLATAGAALITFPLAAALAASSGWASVLALAGLAAVEALGGHVRAEVAVLFACIFGGFYAFRRSYLFLVVCFTALIALFYSLVGRFTPGILLLRLEETTLGAAIAVVIATVVLRAPTTSRVRDSVAGELRAIRNVLDALSGEPLDPATLRRRSREHDRALLDLLDAYELLRAPPIRRHPTAQLRVEEVLRLATAPACSPAKRCAAARR